MMRGAHKTVLRLFHFIRQTCDQDVRVSIFVSSILRTTSWVTARVWTRGRTETTSSASSVSPRRSPTWFSTHSISSVSVAGTFTSMSTSNRVPTNQGIQGKFWRLFPVREIREKQGFFSQNQGKKFQIRELFFQTIFKPFKPINLRKMFFKTVKPQELSGNCNICID